MSAPSDTACMVDLATFPVPDYSDTEHETWTRLYARQRELLPGRACDEYLAGLARLELSETRLPRLVDISRRIEQYTGWRLTRVAGLVENDDFFTLLAGRCFPSTDFIRKPDELDYTPAPDMFHDLIGHAPLLTHSRFAAFFERFGHAGKAAFASGHPATEWLPRIYWYTVEFGLIRAAEGLRIYGSGIVSSPGEVLHSLSDAVTRHDFDLDAIAARDYDIWHMQNDLFVIDSFDQLEDDFAAWCREARLG
ncbi:phenylalanine 4-monooxygenase [Microvirgula aerodenitrificans]|uniref:phenylalanine 4-monooxygenase n=1 Tax=Microvirgula aerodenitrificans TaxID=57480 RepID=UPI000688F4E6|nr:phenylalanine 4-monooxygenase [Microvirgula aerodenitrificans]